jgi:hypothetical protein
MRKRGRRLPWREINNGPSFVGTLQSYRVTHGEQSFNAISLQVGSQTDLLPKLYEPVLDGIAANAFILRGYERVETSEGYIGVVQEWHCRDP